MPLLENLHHGAHVESSDGKDVGRLHSIVIDPRDNEVTHIVVNAGPHFPEPGFGSPELREVPIDVVKDAGDEKVILGCTRDEFGRLCVATAVQPQPTFESNPCRQEAMFSKQELH